MGAEVRRMTWFLYLLWVLVAVFDPCVAAGPGGVCVPASQA